MSQKKKVLLINGQSLYENNSTSITLKSIISYFDNKDILEVHYYPVTNFNGNNEQIETVQLDQKTKLLYSMVSKFYKGKVKSELNNKMLKSEIESKSSWLKDFKQLILAYDDYLPIRTKYNKKQAEKIEAFKPDIIYTLGSSIFVLELSLLFANKYNIPIVLHHMDNWRETKYKDSFILKPCRKKLLNSLFKVESVMHRGLTISDEMAKYYNLKSPGKYVSLMNTVPKMDIIKHPESKSKQINIIYAGGLHLNRWKVILEFEKLVNKVSFGDQVVKLNIFTKEEDAVKYKNKFHENITTFHRFLPHDQVYKIYEMADILIHVESFDKNLIEFTKYSLSTKIPEYMSSGKPIICYAPKKIAVSNYITKHKCGISVSNNKELERGLKQLIEHKSLRINMGINGVKAAAEKHSEEYKNQVMENIFNYDENQ